jgi:carbon-monoxide dehydrogenase medium subunit
MKLPNFEYFAPTTAAEVVRLLAAHPGESKIIAGGQSLLPTMAFRLAQPAYLIDLRKLDELRGIVIDNSAIVLGARTRWRDIEDDVRLRTAQPLLVEAVRHVAHYQVRNRGTVGGSLAHADPAAEMPCIAVTCEAEVRVLGSGGERRIAAADFFVGPLTTALAEDEIILDVRLPLWPFRRRWAFLEFSRRPGDFALAGIALFYDVDSHARADNAHVGVVGACYYPQRLPRTEAALNGTVVDADVAAAVARVAAAEVDPPEDIHANVQYRRALVATLAERALFAAARRAPPSATAHT